MKYPLIGQSIETEGKLIVATGWQGGRKRSDCQQVWGFFWGDENVLELVVVSA